MSRWNYSQAYGENSPSKDRENLILRGSQYRDSAKRDVCGFIGLAPMDSDHMSSPVNFIVIKVSSQFHGQVG